MKTKDKIDCQCINECNNRIYILTRNDSSILSFDTDLKKGRYIGTLRSGEVYCTSCVVDSKILYFTASSSVVCEYNYEENTIKYVDINISNTNKTLKECWMCFEYHGYVFIACGTGSEPLVRLDPTNYSAESKSEWNEAFERKYGKQAVICARNRPCIVGNELWVPLNEPNTVLQYNLENDSYNLHELPMQRMQFYTLNCEGKEFWLTGDSMCVVKWDFEDNSIILYKEFPNEFDYIKGKAPWEGLFYVGYNYRDDIIFIPLEGNMIIGVNKNSGSMRGVGEMYNDKYCFHSFRLQDGRIYAEFDDSGSTRRSDSIVIDSCGDVEERAFLFDLVQSSLHDYAKLVNNTEQVLRENYNGMLSMFLEIVEGVSSSQSVCE